LLPIYAHATWPPAASSPARCVAPLDRHFTVTAESFSEKQSFPRAKWRAVAMGGTGIRKQRPSALAEPPGCCTRPIAMENARLQPFSSSCATFQRGAETREQRLQPGRGKVCGRARRRALCARCSRLVCQVNPRAARHAHTHEYLTVHTAWTAQHARLMCSRAAARQWSSHAMDIYGSTSRGPLHVVVVHAVVQWLASLCRMRRPRAIARSTSHSACAARVVRGRS